MAEEYRGIEGYDNYQISNFGNVRIIKNNKIMSILIDRGGYKRIGLTKDNKKKKFYVHRLIAIAFLDNPQNKKLVDHIDNNPSNNNLNNLRFATNQENNFNSKISKNNTTTVKGVTFCTKRNKFIAQIQFDGIKIKIGAYETLEEAKRARILKATAVFGEFLNECEKL
jgi:hypothetical protein